MQTSGRLYYDKFRNLVNRIGTLNEKVRASEKNAIDANWIDAGSIDYISRLVEKAIAELEGG